MSTNKQHPIWNPVYGDSEAPDIDFLQLPDMATFKKIELSKDSIVLIYENDDWTVYTYTLETQELIVVEDIEKLKLQILKYLRTIASTLSGLASYAEIVGALHHNRDGIRKFCDRQAAYNRTLKEIEWWEENASKKPVVTNDTGVLTLGAGSTFQYKGIEYTLVQVPSDGAWQWMNTKGKHALCQGFYTTFPPTVEQVFAMAKHLP